jgi:hypothetical protein
VDHALDAVATPAAVGAGTVAAGVILPVDEPWLRWTAAAVAGGGSAGVVQSGTVLLRGVTGATTGGLGNWVVATAEWVGSIVMTILAIVVPVLAAIVALVIVLFVVKNARRVARLIRDRRQRRRRTPLPA